MNQHHIAEAMLGQDVTEFINSDVGRYLLGVADQEIGAAHQLLATVSPWRRNRIRELQNQVWRANSFKQWLADAITAGRNAEYQLEQNSDE